MEEILMEYKFLIVGILAVYAIAMIPLFIDNFDTKQILKMKSDVQNNNSETTQKITDIAVDTIQTKEVLTRIIEPLISQINKKMNVVYEDTIYNQRLKQESSRIDMINIATNSKELESLYLEIESLIREKETLERVLTLERTTNMQYLKRNAALINEVSTLKKENEELNKDSKKDY